MLLSLAYNFTVAVYTHLNQIFDHTLRFSVGILRTELQKGVHVVDRAFELIQIILCLVKSASIKAELTTA